MAHFDREGLGLNPGKHWRKKLMSGYSVVSSIKKIVELGPEFDLLTLADREKLIERQVDVIDSRRAELIPSR